MLRTKVVAFILVCIIAGNLSAGDDPRPGTVVKNVKCGENGEFGYALYLPAGYVKEKTWPVLFCFSPDGRGAVPVDLFRECAEKYGYIVVGSNDSKNGPLQTDAINAMIADVRTRFSVDPKRNYATGFSGGARVALLTALGDRQFAGVISCGAFYTGRPGGDDVRAEQMPAVFCFIGDSDPNHAELMRAFGEFGRKKTAYWIEEFVGGHVWPDQTIIENAFVFMRIAAMRAGLVAADDDLVKRVSEQRLASCDGLVEKGLKPMAARRYCMVRDFFAGTAAAEKAAAKIAELEAAGTTTVAPPTDFQKLLEGARNVMDRDGFERAIRGLFEVASVEGPNRANAQTALSMIGMQLQRAGQGFIQQKQHERAAVMLDRLLIMDPKNGIVAYNLACCLSLTGRKVEACEMLKRSVENGYLDAGHIAADTDLDNIRDEPGYREALELIGKKGARENFDGLPIPEW